MRVNRVQKFTPLEGVVLVEHKTPIASEQSTLTNDVCVLRRVRARSLAVRVYAIVLMARARGVCALSECVRAWCVPFCFATGCYGNDGGGGRRAAALAHLRCRGDERRATGGFCRSRCQRAAFARASKRATADSGRIEKSDEKRRVHFAL